MNKPAASLRMKLAVASVTTLVCLGAAELALRLLAPVQTFVNPLASFHLFDPELGWIGTPELKAKFRKVDFTALVRSDASGFRAREAAVQPGPGSPVWAVLGDSFTWGWGVDNGRVFTDVMQNELGAGADVRNFGVNAYGTFQEWLLLKRCLDQGLRPRHVIVMFFENDYHDNVDNADTRKPSLQVTGTNVTVCNQPVLKNAVGPFKRFVKKSHLLSAITYLADYAKVKRKVKALGEATFVERAVAEPPRMALSFCLKQFAETCKTAGSQLWFVYVPTFGDVQATSTSQSRSVLQSLCGQKGIRLLDLTAGFRRAAGNHPLAYYFPHDGHWNAAGHELAGRLITAFIKQEAPSAQ